MELIEKYQETNEKQGKNDTKIAFHLSVLLACICEKTKWSAVKSHSIVVTGGHLL